MSELGSSSDMPFEIRAVHDVGYPGVTTRTRRSGVFLAQIALKVQVLLRSFFCLFSHLPKKKSSRLVLRRPVELEAALEV